MTGILTGTGRMDGNPIGLYSNIGNQKTINNDNNNGNQKAKLLIETVKRKHSN